MANEKQAEQQRAKPKALSVRFKESVQFGAEALTGLDAKEVEIEVGQVGVTVRGKAPKGQADIVPWARIDRVRVQE